MSVEIEVSNNIVVRGMENKLREHWKKHLTIPNPQYYKLMHATGNRARAFYGTPSEFKYFKELEDGTIAIPRGMLDPLLDFLTSVGVAYNLRTTSLIHIPL